MFFYTILLSIYWFPYGSSLSLFLSFFHFSPPPFLISFHLYTHRSPLRPCAFLPLLFATSPILLFVHSFLLSLKRRPLTTHINLRCIGTFGSFLSILMPLIPKETKALPQICIVQCDAVTQQHNIWTKQLGMWEGQDLNMFEWTSCIAQSTFV